MDADPRGKGVAVVLCVGHLIVGVVVALIAVGAFAIFG
ncbi:hypothetical protein U91I_04214 [alpha proteobacterium U9-1i]|nr:hypothetical protein U91I_04214 [alpha proteobacterium U9-1i]